MGRIKTTFIKQKTKEILELHGDQVTGDFVANKKITGKLTDVSSKKLRNTIAGYLTRLKKKEAK